MLRVCTVYVGELFFAIPVASIREVIRAPRVTRVPLANPIIAGLTNLRGSMVTLIDLHRCLGVSATDTSASSMAVVLKARNGTVALLIDRVGDVVEIPEKSEALPTTIAVAVRNVTSGAQILDGKLLLMLDETKAVRELDAEGAVA
jgi:purine-binding chemotaxis protein CheW